MARFHIFLVLFLMFGLQASCKDCRTHSCLRKLYNSKVVRAEYWIRSLSGSGSSGSSGPSSGGRGWWSSRKRSFDYNYHFRHTGAVVTLKNRERWLIHKGSDYGDAYDTVITDANYMSSRVCVIYRWNRRQSWWVARCGYTVNTFMQNALISRPYKLVGASCQTAANSMWRLVERCNN
ncbi:uncharacterized protein LOC134241195 [Saccostrea cucullata]|uniref:uncharacterized protein LOC134241195 n=1 Tax=Saccostrea cuccullata TaxID=36930 RepID=UPI002ED662A6